MPYPTALSCAQYFRAKQVRKAAELPELRLISPADFRLSTVSAPASTNASEATPNEPNPLKKRGKGLSRTHLRLAAVGCGVPIEQVVHCLVARQTTVTTADKSVTPSRLEHTACTSALAAKGALTLHAQEKTRTTWLADNEALRAYPHTGMEAANATQTRIRALSLRVRLCMVHHLPPYWMPVGNPSWCPRAVFLKVSTETFLTTPGLSASPYDLLCKCCCPLRVRWIAAQTHTCVPHDVRITSLTGVPFSGC
ncbi:hypothetical protein DFH07DRAFT_952457 [Mycena maculata]|uniref:Uncharacterized protein n=1 Tax=Mycena maculata TaxID=230809 RepID=A0AAD7NT87_9AGAR|nr:hypothetical protein DFH07DRAFT_952457 [Mycena maculata]